MDRRTFLTGVGTIGAAATGGWNALAPDAGAARAATLARAAGAKSDAASKPEAPGAGSADGITVGFLPGSPALIEMAMRGDPWGSSATQLRWERWDPAATIPRLEPMASISIGMLQPSQVAGVPVVLRSLEVVAFFAFNESPYVAPFPAWKFEAPGKSSKRGAATSPLTFDAAMDDRVGLQVNYALEPGPLAPGVRGSGMVYLPLGAAKGPGLGLYVLAGPSRRTGAPPDLREHRFSGDLHAPIPRSLGGPDFDYVTMMIRRSAA